MATQAHHPKSRGFDSWLGYWHHANDYWKQTIESCPAEAAAAARPSLASPLDQDPSPIDGLGLGGGGDDGSSSVDVKDLWRFDGALGVDGPATDLANGPKCSQYHQGASSTSVSGGAAGGGAGGDGGVGPSCVFEEYLLAGEAAGLVRTHNDSKPLFLVYAMHLVHFPLQAPDAVLVALGPDVAADDGERRRMVAMTRVLDDAVGLVVDAVKEPKQGVGALTWNNTLIVVHSDNG